MVSVNNFRSHSFKLQPLARPEFSIRINQCPTVSTPTSVCSDEGLILKPGSRIISDDRIRSRTIECDYKWTAPRSCAIVMAHDRKNRAVLCSSDRVSICEQNSAIETKSSSSNGSMFDVYMKCYIWIAAEMKCLLSFNRLLQSATIICEHLVCAVRLSDFCDCTDHFHNMLQWP